MNSEEKTVSVPVELSDSELEKTAGGNELGAQVQFGSLIFKDRVDMYQGKLGMNYYIVDDGKDEWFYGTMLDSYEVPFTFHTVRTHIFRYTVHNGQNVSGTREFCGDDFTLYRTKIDIHGPSLG